MPETTDVREAFLRVLEKEREIGLANILSTWFLDPPSIFDPNAGKRPRPEFVMVLAYLGLMAAVCAAFNLS
jgi:hypothetical protein